MNAQQNLYTLRHLKMTTLAIFIIFLASTKAAYECDGSEPIITKVKQGDVRGISMVSVRGKRFCAFRGIPYAKPPIGHLRFRPPEPIKAWEDVLSATREGDECVHPAFVLPITRGNEDCLYLNVYTPLLRAGEGEMLHVMVFIPPGQFYAMSGSSRLLGPEFLMDKNIVLVTFNYRLGAFGFLSTEDDESPGNYGMKDQVAALKWIKENIRAFSGNPNSITLFGQEAGGASVHYHMLSHLSRGLFHRGISMDGTAVMPWATSPKPLELAKKQAYLLGCPTSPTKNLVECLREKSSTQINRSIYKLFELWYLPGPGYAPVVEKQSTQNPEPFITQDPVQMMTVGNFLQVPWIIGGNTQSAAIFFVPVLNLKRLRKKLKKDCWPQILMLPNSVTPDKIDIALNNISSFYDVDLHFQYPEQDMRTIMMLTDRYYSHGIHKAALLHVQAGHKSIYRYNFAYKGMFSNTLATSLRNYGVSLGDELRYLFDVNIFNKRLRKFHIPKNFHDREVQELMLTLWTDFSKYGSPIPSKRIKGTDSTGLLEYLKWEPMDMHKMRYFNIGQVELSPALPQYLNQVLGAVKLNMAIDLNKNRMNFWDSLPLRENIKRLKNVTQDSNITADSTRVKIPFLLWILFPLYGNLYLFPQILAS